MKKTSLKRCLCAALAALMIMPLTACEKKEPPMASKENIFSTRDMEMPMKFDTIHSMESGGDRIFLIGSTYEYSGEGENYKWKNETIMSIIDMDGNPIKNVTLQKQSSEDMENGGESVNRNISRMCVDGSGNVTLLANEYTWDPETGGGSESYFVLRYDNEGNSLGEVALESIKPENENDYIYIRDIVVDDDGHIVICGENTVYVLDKDGKQLFDVKSEENGKNSGSYMNGVYRVADGRIVAIINKYEIVNDEYKNTMTASVLDMDQKKFSDEYVLNSRWYSFYNGGGDYDLYVSNDSSLMGVDIETGTATTVIDWLKSGFDNNTLDNVIVLPDGRLLAVTYKYEASGSGYSWGGNGMVLTMLTKLDPADIPDKKLISITAFYLDWNIKQKIVEFNKNNLEYQIEVNTYSDYDDGTGSYSAGVTKLNNDLIAGNIPDILLVDNSMSFDSYISKGMIADLYTFIDKDPDIKREDYLENILDAFSVKGKLYRITPTFSLQTLVGKKKFVGDTPGWTMQDYVALRDANPDKDMMSYEMTKDGFLISMLNCSLSDFVDREKGECHFDSDGFKNLLETANTYPLEINNDGMVSIDWEKRQTAFREDRAIINTEYFYSFNRIREIEDATFGEPVTFIGYPSSSGNGTLIYPGSQLAITKKAKNPDGAWEFVRYFLTDEYQNANTNGFPIKISAYDELMEKAKKKPTYTDADGNEVESDNIYWMGGTEVKVGVNTDEDNQRMMELIKSAKAVYQYDEDLMKIITEETAAYFNGQKSVDEVAGIIQNRATTYISESM